jgi:hypothetical protein
MGALPWSAPVLGRSNVPTSGCVKPVPDSVLRQACCPVHRWARTGCARSCYSQVALQISAFPKQPGLKAQPVIARPEGPGTPPPEQSTQPARQFCNSCPPPSFKSEVSWISNPPPRIPIRLILLFFPICYSQIPGAIRNPPAPLTIHYPVQISDLGFLLHPCPSAVKFVQFVSTSLALAFPRHGLKAKPVIARPEGPGTLPPNNPQALQGRHTLRRGRIRPRRPCSREGSCIHSKVGISQRNSR